MQNIPQATLGNKRSLNENFGIINGNFSESKAMYPMRLPLINASAFTFTQATAADTSVLSSGLIHTPANSSKFTLCGSPTSKGTAYPDYYGLIVGNYAASADAMSAVEFYLSTPDSTGRFEIRWKTIGASCRVLVFDNVQQNWVTLGTGEMFAHAGATSSIFYDLVTLGSSGTYRIRLEFSSACAFLGVKTATTSCAIYPTPKRKQVMLVGDSHTAPTIRPSGMPWQGLGAILGYLTGYDVWTCANAGGGYCTVGVHGGVLLDRIPTEVAAYSPEAIIVVLGANDLSSNVTTFTSAVTDSLAALRAITKDIIVCSFFYPFGMEYATSTVPQYRDVLKNVAESLGIDFVDLLDAGIPDWITDKDWESTVSATVSSGTSIQVASVPAYFQVASAGPMWMKFGEGANQKIFEVTSKSGTGPYTLVLRQTIASSIAAGTRVSLCGPSYMTGGGTVAVPTGAGTSDVMTYSAADQHYTVIGHEFWGKLLATKLIGR